MKLIKTILYIEKETPDITRDVLDSLQIIDAASDTFSICGNAANSILGIKEIDLRLKQHKADINNEDYEGLSAYTTIDLANKNFR